MSVTRPQVLSWAQLPKGNTVDLVTVSYRNDIGAAVGGAPWRDPDFSFDQRAFYYIRVLEIPTPIWLAYDKAFYGMRWNCRRTP